jgi:hypothetical protein
VRTVQRGLTHIDSKAAALHLITPRKSITTQVRHIEDQKIIARICQINKGHPLTVLALEGALGSIDKSAYFLFNGHH